MTETLIGTSATTLELGSTRNLPDGGLTVYAAYCNYRSPMVVAGHRPATALHLRGLATEAGVQAAASGGQRLIDGIASLGNSIVDGEQACSNIHTSTRSGHPQIIAKLSI